MHVIALTPQLHCIIRSRRFLYSYINAWSNPNLYESSHWWCIVQCLCPHSHRFQSVPLYEVHNNRILGRLCWSVCMYKYLQITCVPFLYMGC